MLSLARLACLLGALAIAGPTSAQTVTDASPTSAAVGTTLQITGTGFGLKKPKVQLFDTATNKKYTLKVTAFSDTAITATITKAVVGDLKLQVLVSKLPVAEGPDLISIERPLVTSLSTAQAGPDAEFSIFGDFFGIQKGKVRIGTQNAKVVSWAMNEVKVKMPKKLYNGLFDVVLTNKLGLDDGADVTMINSPIKIGTASMNLAIDGKPVKLKYTPSVPVGGQIVLVGVSASNPSENLQIVIPFNAANESAPKVINGGVTLLMTYIQTGKISGFQLPPMAIWTASGLGVGTPSVTITASSGGQVAGTINSTLVLQQNTFSTSKPQTVQLTGSFIADV